MSQARALSSEDVRGLREELSAGGTPTVWFTSAAVGVQEGRSGKVTALGDPEEGDFIQVRPAGSKDVLSFSAGEVTVVKPAPRNKGSDAAGKSGDTKSGSVKSGGAKSGGAKSGGAKSGGAKSGGAKSGGAGRTASGTAAAQSASRPATVVAAAEGSSESGSAQHTSASKQAAGGEARTAAAARRKASRPAGATVTLTAGSDGQWSVEVSNGKKRVLRPTAVPASAVAHAAKALHADVARAVEPLLEAAREHQRARVEQLQQELSEAQRMLDDLNE
ncbi:hypothetical protein DFQ14_103257 [Halopolyspora algeriensis]|uniref:Cell wall anchor protein n=1 Tax=Halopolyspora algeriensis TaxID=1500506 RepID=A0A368VX23_9ACTN|nr:DUF6319 family protein [Halopolyspora algeriensis]RCW45288.1 hypothetical protein DFQ14_103257 [Halopolyspora algeriensis]TQM47328.1 hypothetical protein FHU43_3313 [Halopolyspora algeriensis]